MNPALFFQSHFKIAEIASNTYPVLHGYRHSPEPDRGSVIQCSVKKIVIHTDFEVRSERTNTVEHIAMHECALMQEDEFETIIPQKSYGP